MDREEIIMRLIELYAEETEAAIRYQHLAMTLKGLDRLRAREILLRHVEETLEHARLIADRILQLGGAPSLAINLRIEPELVTAEEALRTALAFEEAGLEGYTELLDKVKGDVVLEDFVRSQIAIESQHVSELSLLLA